MTKTYTFHNDPGHGWLKVSRSELEVLGVVQNISPCSYQDAQTVYLEEDLDAGVFMRAARAAGWTFELEDKYVPGESFVRRLPSYEP